jgi:AcrR family transcriptional regulator
MSGVAQNQPSPRRERLRREREERILEAAATVFARRGYHQATIREIAELSDVADGTIYNYFANKRDLLVAMTRHLVADSVADTLAQFQAEDDRSYLTAIVGERFDFLERNSAFVRALMTEVWSDETFRDHYLSQVIAPMLSLMENYLQARIEAGSVRSVDTRVAVRAMAGSFLIFLLLSQPGHGGLRIDLPREELVHGLVDFFLLGLQARPDMQKRDPR